MRLPSVPGLGLGTTDHVLPFQCSVRVWLGVNCPLEYSPAAQTSLPLPVAALRLLVSVPTLGLATCDHALPFQCSVSVRPGWPPVLLYIPTAQTSLPLPVAPKR